MYGWRLSCGNGHQLVSTGSEFWIFHTYYDDIADVKFAPVSGDHFESAILYTDPGPSIWDRIRMHFGFEPSSRGRILAKVDFDGRETSEE